MSADSLDRNRRLQRPSIWLVFRHRSVLVRALHVRVKRPEAEHVTARCACEFCHAYRELVSHEPHPKFDSEGEYVAAQNTGDDEPPPSRLDSDTGLG